MSGILVVDDEAGIRELLREILQDEGHDVRLAENAAEARAARQLARPDLVLLDIWMPDMDGISLLKEWAASGQLSMPVIMMSGHGTIDTAVEATKIGASDFLEKPIALQKLLKAVESALRRETTRPAPVALFSLGRSPAVNALRQRLSQVANLRTPVLLVGERGCGAGHWARLLHGPNTPFVAPENHAWLAERPLEILQQARDGLLFIDHLQALSRTEQKGLALLLARAEKHNARVVCACERSLWAEVEAGHFDGPLFQALSGLTLSLPALMDHRDDIPDLANAFLARLVDAGEAPLRRFSTAALNALRTAEWPGNLAQLENTVKTLALSCLGDEIGEEDVRQALSAFSPEPAPPGAAPASEAGSSWFDQPLREARDAFEKVYFEHHLARSDGNVSRVAEISGVERTHLYRKLKQLGIKFSGKTPGK
jgi:DNA-binding NtrC family response regulator